MKVISISGLDGSGKSTQLELLKQSFEKKSQKTYYFHAVHFSLANKLRKKKSRIDSVDPGITKASAVSILLRICILPVDIVRFQLLLRKLKRQKFDVVLSDRFFYDSLVNIAYLRHRNTLMRVPIPKPDYAFFLRISPKEIIKRSRVPEQGTDYLVKKEPLYEELAKFYPNIIPIDALLPAESVSFMIVEHCNAS